jgi:hypothetical protein
MHLVPDRHLDVEGEVGITACRHADIQRARGDARQLIQNLLYVQYDHNEPDSR